MTKNEIVVNSALATGAALCCQGNDLSAHPFSLGVALDLCLLPGDSDQSLRGCVPDLFWLPQAPGWRGGSPGGGEHVYPSSLQPASVFALQASPA